MTMTEYDYWNAGQLIAPLDIIQYVSTVYREGVLCEPGAVRSREQCPTVSCLAWSWDFFTLAEDQGIRWPYFGDSVTPMDVLGQFNHLEFTWHRDWCNTRVELVVRADPYAGDGEPYIFLSYKNVRRQNMYHTMYNLTPELLASILKEYGFYEDWRMV